jgi:hypothetical protein
MASLTRAGLDTLKIVPATEDLDIVKNVAEHLKLLGPTKVQIADAVRSPDGNIQGYVNAKDV